MYVGNIGAVGALTGTVAEAFIVKHMHIEPVQRKLVRNFKKVVAEFPKAMDHSYLANDASLPCHVSLCSLSGSFVLLTGAGLCGVKVWRHALGAREAHVRDPRIERELVSSASPLIGLTAPVTDVPPFDFD